MFNLSSQNKVHFTTLGCPRNTVDSELMLGLLLQKGYEVCLDPSEADYLVVNTCGFLKAAQEEGESVIQSLIDSKKKEAKLIVTGCLVSRHKEEVKQHFPEIDVLLGSGDIESIVTALESDKPLTIIGDQRSYLAAGEVPRVISTSHYGYLKIAEGCKKNCAYCVIPQIKGKLRSKSIEQVTQEFRALIQRGIKEVILIAQDLGDFGKDLGLKQQGLELLLNALRKVPGDVWIRLLYLYPDEITDRIIDAMQQDPRIVPYLDMPIQHIDDTILKSMHRKTSSDQIYQVIETLRSRFNPMFIRTSLIVGYPGETSEQFEKLCSFVKQVKLEHVGIFPFSKEEGSYAAQLNDQIQEEVKIERVEHLSAIQNEISYEKNQSFVGKTFEIMVDQIHPESEHLLMGHHRGQCPDVDGCVILNENLGQIKSFGDVCVVKITQGLDYDLIGTVIRNKRKVKLTLV